MKNLGLRLRRFTATNFAAFPPQGISVAPTMSAFGSLAAAPR
jgi:hypothetical protein